MGWSRGWGKATVHPSRRLTGSVTSLLLSVPRHRFLIHRSAAFSSSSRLHRRNVALPKLGCARLAETSTKGDFRIVGMLIRRTTTTATGIRHWPRVGFSWAIRTVTSTIHMKCDWTCADSNTSGYIFSCKDRGRCGRGWGRNLGPR